MKIAFEDFRCFHRPGSARIAPLTVLLGENSTGKTSFLAGIRAAYDMFSSNAEPDFNVEPFLLGAYEQIANTRPGFQRAESFKFHISDDVVWSVREKPAGASPTFDRGELSVGVTFGQNGSQPFISAVSIGLTVGDRQDYIRFAYSDDDTVSVSSSYFEDFSFPIQGSYPIRLFAAPRRRGAKASLVEIALSMSFDLDYLDRFYAREKTTKLVAKLGSDRRDALSNALRVFIMKFRAPLIPVAPVRTRPRRTYDPVSEAADPEGAHAPMLLARLKTREPNNWKRFGEFVAEFGKESGLFNRIDVRRRGQYDSDPFQLMVSVTKANSNLIDVGYGVSQVLPVLVDLFEGQRESWHLLQQPEVHLHPRGQAALASLFMRYIKERQGYVVIETHSEYILDRLMILIREKKLEVRDLSILYFWTKGNEQRIDEIKINSEGDIAESPTGYRDFFRKEMRRFFDVT